VSRCKAASISPSLVLNSTSFTASRDCLCVVVHRPLSSGQWVAPRSCVPPPIFPHIPTAHAPSTHPPMHRPDCGLPERSHMCPSSGRLRDERRQAEGMLTMATSSAGTGPSTAPSEAMPRVSYSRDVGRNPKAVGRWGGGVRQLAGRRGHAEESAQTDTGIVRAHGRPVSASLHAPNRAGQRRKAHAQAPVHHLHQRVQGRAGASMHCSLCPALMLPACLASPHPRARARRCAGETALW